MQIYGQELMRITTNDGLLWNFSVNNVEEMSFSISKKMNIVGEWLTVYHDDGIPFIERMTFNSDGSCMSCSYIFPIFDNRFTEKTEMQGTYTVNNNLIRINFSNGQSTLIEVLELSDNRMCSGVGDVFYKVREPAYHVTTADEPFTIGDEGDVIKLTDNYYTIVEGNKIKAVTDGTGYVLAEDVNSNELKAYKVEIEYVQPPMIDWTQYFNVSSDEIKEKFGNYDFKNEGDTWVYMRYNAAIQSVEFTFFEDTKTVKEIEINFYEKRKGQSYCEYIANNYTLYNTSGAVKLYVNPTNPLEVIYVESTNDLLRIIYNCKAGN